MLDSNDRVIVNQTDVAAEVIDGEAIIMNLSTGMYYSMDGVGALLWNWAGRGHTLAEMTQALQERFGVAPLRAEADLERLVEQMIREGLVQVAPIESAPLGPPAVEAVERAYETPELNRYGDMAELLALDPPMPTPALSPWKAPGEAV